MSILAVTALVQWTDKTRCRDTSASTKRTKAFSWSLLLSVSRSSGGFASPITVIVLLNAYTSGRYPPMFVGATPLLSLPSTRTTGWIQPLSASVTARSSRATKYWCCLLSANFQRYRSSSERPTILFSSSRKSTRYAYGGVSMFARMSSSSSRLSL